MCILLYLTPVAHQDAVKVYSAKQWSVVLLLSMIPVCGIPGTSVRSSAGCLAWLWVKMLQMVLLGVFLGMPSGHMPLYFFLNNTPESLSNCKTIT